MQGVGPGHRPIRIGIDGRNLQGDRRGDGRYVYELCRHLDQYLPNAEFFVYSSSPADLPVTSERWRLRGDHRAFAVLPPLLWLKLRAWQFCLQDRLDIFWGTNTFLPFLPRGVRKIVTVHDLCFQITPETYTRPHLWANRLFFLRDLRRSNVVVANSRGTAERVAPILHYRPSVVCPGVASQFRPQTPERIQACLVKYGIAQPYLLNVASWEPRKNVERLVASFLNLKEAGALPLHRLVLAGKKFCRYDRLEALIAGDGGRWIDSLGYVPDADLPALYAGAEMFVFPSYYEGYGLPVIEARACGTTVVTSDVPELHEAGGANAIYVDPTEEGIAQGILRALDRSSADVRPSDLPTWEDAGKKLAAAMLETVDR